MKTIIYLSGLILLCTSMPTLHSQEMVKNAQKEFQLTKGEKRDLEKYISKVKTKNDFNLIHILKDAYDGDPIAMYVAGQCCLLGTGTSINQEVANLYFTMAASLGYAPALYEVAQIYCIEKQDPLLSLVYVNLTISNGHREYRDLYYKQTEIISKLYGPKIVKEIERLALEKSIKIDKFRDEIKKNENTSHPGIKLRTDNIVSYDFLITEKHWKELFPSEEIWTTFFFRNPQRNS